MSETLAEHALRLHQAGHTDADIARELHLTGTRGPWKVKMMLTGLGHPPRPRHHRPPNTRRDDVLRRAYATGARSLHDAVTQGTLTLEEALNAIRP